VSDRVRPAPASIIVPLSCPMPDMTLWNSHPRIYLPIEPTGFAKCPYCGAEYTLVR